MNAVREQAFRLRLSGKSYNEITRALGVPKSTLSGWFKHIVLSDTAHARLLSRARLGSVVLVKRNKMQTHESRKRAQEARRMGKSAVPRLTRNDLLVAGVALYWAEGYKRLKVIDGKERMSHAISFVNSDVEMVRVFIRFLREILAVPSEEIRLYMRLYKHINEAEARCHWAQVTGLPSAQFHKTTFLVSGASKGKRPFNRLPFGTLQVEVCDTAKFHQLLGLIEGVKEKLSHGKVPSLPG